MESLVSVSRQHAEMVNDYRLAHRKAARAEADYRAIRAKAVIAVRSREGCPLAEAQHKADASDVVRNAHLERNLAVGDVAVIREHLHELAEQQANGRTAVVEARQADQWAARGYDGAS